MPILKAAPGIRCCKGTCRSALLLKPTRDVLEQTKDGIKAARLLAIKKKIQASLGDPRLSLTGVAARLGVSPRYARMLFEPGDTSFSEYLLSERLAHACRMLGDPRFASYPVAQIALEAGFAVFPQTQWKNRIGRKSFGEMLPVKTPWSRDRRG